MNNKKVALITGACRGIGRGIAIELAKIGFNIAGVDIEFDSENKSKGLFEVKERVEELNCEFLPIQCDLSSLDDHQRVLDEVINKFGKVDILVNNAGVAPLDRLDILDTTPESYDRVMNINLRSPFFLSQLVANQMLEGTINSNDHNPMIIFITSISATVSSPSRAEYCVSKAGLSMVSKIFADRLAGSGIKVFELRPGIIQTDMTAKVKEKYDKLIAEGLIPQNRWGQPEDVGKAVASISQGNFDYSTGMVFEVSGGMNIQSL